MATKSETTRLNRGWARNAWAWGPVLLYMGVIFAASGVPTVTLPGITLFTDKISHAVGYSGLALLAYRAAHLVPLKARGGPYAQAFTVAAIYGASDEYHQSFVPGRSADVIDWIADVIGILAALAAIVFIRQVIAKGGKAN